MILEPRSRPSSPLCAPDLESLAPNNTNNSEMMSLPFCSYTTHPFPEPAEVGGVLDSQVPLFLIIVR